MEKKTRKYGQVTIFILIEIRLISIFVIFWGKLIIGATLFMQIGSKYAKWTSPDYKSNFSKLISLILSLESRKHH